MSVALDYDCHQLVIATADSLPRKVAVVFLHKQSGVVFGRKGLDDELFLWRCGVGLEGERGAANAGLTAVLLPVKYIV